VSTDVCISVFWLLLLLLLLLQAPAAVEPVEAVQEDDELQERLNAMRTT
jgi:hypothetical protein